jgi:phosphatidylinositol alpha-1,6-mannosyltransferase
VDVDNFRPGHGREVIRSRYALGTRPVVVSVSRLVKRKGHDRLIDAWPAVRRAVPDAALLIVGDGPARRRLERLAASSGHVDSIVFSGAVEPSELPPHLAAADVFALPIRDRWRGLETEGLGLALLEGSAMGLPVVAGRSGGTPSAVLDGRTGHLVDGRDSSQIATAVTSLLTNLEQARAMGAAGREWVADTFSWDALADRLAGQLLARPTSACG